MVTNPIVSKTMTTRGLESLARLFFQIVDSQQASALRPFVCRDIRLQLANEQIAVGADALISVFEASQTKFKSIEHDIQGIWTGHWHGGDVVSVEAIARYRLKRASNASQSDIDLPVTSTLRLNSDGKIADYRIFMNPAPAFGENP